MGELAAASKVHVMVSYWWSRGDSLANHQLGQILSRAAGVGEVDLTDSQSLDRALRIAVTDPAVLGELEAWWQMVETRRAGNGTRNPGLGLDQSIRYLTDRLDAAAITPEVLGECRRQVAAVDLTIMSAKNLPELAHPDAEMLDLLGRYLEARSRVLALA
ncbi:MULTISPECIES: hypothetical protein [Rhodococcus]|uniref:Uncharacterized protein n=1 Tax=Rhodococcus opacus TaxID=37919 RepID=A0AAX3Y9H4_RHOOP|nr:MULTISPECIES: hypothetical protein [Rhodococcus]NHU41839.1 hypothetical protein [Rhodococcus sp. A14]MCZ4586406.1 hypothetical protein [Rhodococcus opacus]MDI9939572.1 hypothetical protein [Rhodococcus sp. IEGM 1351]UZG53076.1 hypothetical protein ONE62_23545 [Rhodococcus opacus]WLF44850.1 hypothetical protein Q5707_23385 [Rhodococcus opacus]